MRGVFAGAAALSLLAACSQPSTVPPDGAAPRILGGSGATEALRAPRESAAPAAPDIADEAAPDPEHAASDGPVLSKDALLGRIDPASDDGFSVIPSRFSEPAGLYARKEAIAAFETMHAAAARDGVNLKIISAFRSFDRQTRIWEDKWTGRTRVEGEKLNESIADPVERARKILEYSSMPGTSRHHWGTDFDFNSLDNRWFESGEGLKVRDWLQANAADFGFCQVYSAKGDDRRTGYEEERWHWSYLPLAGGFLSQHRSAVSVADIAGFAGAETAASVRALDDYVAGISPDCLNSPISGPTSGPASGPGRGTNQ
ncbi:D-alanyl-D-alanine carboxypeptidase family protein [bacterium]|nr:D-alanyl-D-alanine carboxypeptidase family protein [bacterium]